MLRTMPLLALLGLATIAGCGFELGDPCPNLSEEDYQRYYSQFRSTAEAASYEMSKSAYLGAVYDKYDSDYCDLVDMIVERDYDVPYGIYGMIDLLPVGMDCGCFYSMVRASADDVW